MIPQSNSAKFCYLPFAKISSSKVVMVWCPIGFCIAQGTMQVVYVRPVDFDLHQCKSWIVSITVRKKRILSLKVRETVTAWKVSKYEFISGPHFPVFGLNTEREMLSRPEITPYLAIFHAGSMGKPMFWTTFRLRGSLMEVFILTNLLICRHKEFILFGKLECFLKDWHSLKGWFYCGMSWTN